MKRARIEKEDIEKALATSFAEDSLIVLQAGSEKDAAYVEYALLQLAAGTISVEALRAWAMRIDRFRDAYIYDKVARPLRIRLRHVEPEITQFACDAHISADEIWEMVTQQQLRFDLQKPPLCAVLLFESDAAQYVVLAYHHILLDGISAQYALQMLDPNGGMQPTEWLPKAPSTVSTPVALDGFSLQSLLPPAAVTAESGYYYQSIAAQGWEYEAVMAEWVLFLAQASGQDHITIGEVLSARGDDAFAQTALGYYVQTWPLQINVTEAKIGSVKQQLKAERQRRLATAQLPVNQHFAANAFDHCWVVEPVVENAVACAFRSTPHYALSIVFQPKADHLDITFTWNLAKVDRRAAETIGRSFEARLAGNRNLSTDFQPFATPTSTLLDLWQLRVLENGDAIALREIQGRNYSYSELDQLSDRLAGQLHIAPQETVGVRTTYSAAIPIAYLAILKCGGIYVPLDPSISADRLAYIVQDAQISKVITDLEAPEGCTAIHPFPEAETDHPHAQHLAQSSDVCYLIYTSGTTGNPKGCAVTHANLVNLFAGTAQWFDFRSDDVWILAHSYGFDFSTWEIWGALLNGATLCIPNRKQVQDAFEFYEILKAEGVTVLNQTPRSFENIVLVSAHERAMQKLRYLVFGGDKLDVSKVFPWKDSYPELQAVNMYGITETTVHVTFKEIGAQDQGNIGRPLPGYGLAVSNPRHEVIPDGFVGELIVSGQGVCAGYYRNISLTKQKFDHTTDVASYFSGDLGWRMQSEFYYLGRNDRQVKIRGFRIELGEIEHQLSKQMSGFQFRVRLYDEQHLVAFYLGAEQNLSRTLFKEVLPDYAIPTFYIPLPEFKLNVNGKTDEGYLQEAFKRQTQQGSNKYDGILENMISKILGNDINPARSFVENGGDSILAIRLINSLKKEGFNLSVGQLFQAKTLRSLTLEKYDPADTQLAKYAQDLCERYFQEKGHRPTGVYPLLDAQIGILFDCLASPEASLYVEQLCYEIPEHHSLGQLQEAYSSVIAALPALRLKLEKIAGEYYWVEDAQQQLDLRTSNADGLDIAAFLQQDHRAGFQLDGPLMRLTILPRAGMSTTLVWTHHHLLMDGWSLDAFSKLFIAALQVKPISATNAYPQYLLQQGTTLEARRRSLAYWQQRIGQQSPDPVIPYSNVQATTDAQIERRLVCKIPLWASLRSQGITQGSFALAAWSAYVAQQFEQPQLCIGHVQSMRDAALENEIGMLIKTLPFPITVDPELSFAVFAQQVLQQFAEDDAYKNAPLHELQGTQYRLDHLFVFENYPIDRAALTEAGIAVGEFKEKTGADWTTIVYPTADGIELRVMARSMYYDEAYIDSILNGFQKWLSQLRWETLLDDFQWIQPGESTIFGKQNPTWLGSGSILELLQRDAPRPAIQIGDQSISYRQLWTDAAAISTQLQALGFQKGEAVGIDVLRTTDFTTAILATWLAGGVTCSVDRRYPDARKAFIFNNSNARFLLQDKNGSLEIVPIAFEKAVPHDSRASFILHTSGSTGVPKGVVQTHVCLLNLIDWNRKQFGLQGDERILQLSSFGFDASFHEVLLALALGATLVEIPLDERLDIQAIKSIILAQKVTLAWIPARMLNAILDEDPHYLDACTSLRNIVTTGEALTIGHNLADWVRRSGVHLLNYYGPTETHVVTALAVGPHNISTVPSIGAVLDNCILRLCNSKGQEIPQGFPGELWVAGPHLALGYLNLPEQTAERFVVRGDEIWYKTGDWVRVLENGHLEFLGRKDEQVKIRGFRVEAMEVEHLLLEVAGIQQACVLIDRNHQAIRLVAFCVGDAMDDALFRIKCLEKMPDYMVPEQVIFLPAFPLNSNGKADRGLLRNHITLPREQLNAPDPDSIAVRCWSAILQHTQFAMESEFQLVGGNSILFMRMQAWLERNTGQSFSIKELVVANTPARLDRLITQRSKAAAGSETLPSTFPLNALQRALLISELGNGLRTENPYVLEFSVTLARPIDRETLQAAWMQVVAAFPHLGYGIAAHSQPAQAHWEQVDLQPEAFFKDFQDDDFLGQAPLLRLLHDDARQVRIRWHHILLDGVGATIALHALLDILQGHKIARKPDFSALLRPDLPLAQARAQIAHGVSANVTTRLQGTLLERMAAFANAHQCTDFQLLLLSLHHAVGYAKPIIFADAKAAAGLPGMWTALQGTQLRRDAGDTLDTLLQKTRASIDHPQPFESDIVVNFVELALPGDFITHYESPLPKRCKYPFEFQWVRVADALECTLIFEEGDTRAEALLQDFLQALTQLLGGDFALPQVAQAEIVFDDFDF